MSVVSQLIEEVTAHAQSDSLGDTREICADGTSFPNNLLYIYIYTYINIYLYICVSVCKMKLTPEKATKAQGGSRCLALLFL